MKAAHIIRKSSGPFPVSLFLILAACNSTPTDAQNEDKLTEKSPQEVQTPSTPLDDLSGQYTIEMSDHMKFISNAEGTTEYMERLDNNGKISWYYSSDKGTKNLKLGFVIQNGVEAVYFQSQSRKVYEIHYNDRGFRLMQGDRMQEFVQVNHF